ncbi:Uncharacterised protein g4010 [Pycnogonum litorale]
MDVFWKVTVSSISNAFIPTFVNLVLFIFGNKSEAETKIRRQITHLKAEMQSINMVDEFAKHAKIQRKINKLNEELKFKNQIRSWYVYAIKLALKGFLYFINGTIVLYLLWFYNDEPIMRLAPEWLFPFGFVFSLTYGDAGAVCMTSWLVISNTVARLAAGKLNC